MFDLPNGLAPGNHSVTVTYDGDSTFAGSGGSTTVAVGAPAKSATTTVVQLTTATPTLGQPLSFSITVSAVVSGATATTPGGTAQVSVDSGPPSDVTLTDGAAMFDLPNGLGQGNHSVTVTYDGDSTFAGSGGSTTVAVGAPARSATTTTLTGPSSVNEGATVTFTVTVTSVGGTVTGGTVDFQENGVSLGTTQQVGANGPVTFGTVLGPGAHTVTAVYSGDIGFNPSTSQPVTVTVIGSVAPPRTGDVTSLVTISLTPAPHGKVKPVTTLTLTLVNSSGQVIDGPITVTLNGLKPTARLLGASGFTGARKHRRPFLVLAPGADELFHPGAELSLLLRFRGKPNHFTSTVKAGSATP
jgi:hypothetical protein